MEKYIRITEKTEKIEVKEAFAPMTDEEKKDKLDNMMVRLKDESFGNEDQRKAFASMIYALVRSKDGDAKKFIKELGKVCSNWSDGNFNKEEKKEED